ncbi:hypothetical protein MHUMG1_04513 [Metarhizium humberi]|uniref:Uncharacterized protein n=1 Tax=Metarhizium humberi TaxID=2596975 RepID=A0A9P8S7Y7_9HYPO|nr:hypothetical protein MHUMG1_04513 [Metarhizium humberi]
MASLIDDFVPSMTYNSLPLISQVAEAPELYARDLQDLRELLQKHHVPRGVSIRLIHKHFDTVDSEVMVFDKVTIPGLGVAQIMKPIVPTENSQLRGIHFFVGENASLQAYEYSNYKVPDMSNYGSFLAEFCTIISERRLQRTFGLKLQCDDDTGRTGWTEYELGAKRGTIMFSDGMPMPDGDGDYSVTTEWNAVMNELPRTCKHSTACSHGRSTCKHYKHCNRHPSPGDAGDVSEGILYLGGRKILPGSQMHAIVKQIVAAFG